MTPYREPYDDYQEMFDGFIEQAGLRNYMDIKILANDRLKEIGKVRKANPLVNYLSGFDVVVEFNEEIFDQLEESHQNIVAEELISYISFDTEKNKINIEKPDIMTFSGILSKYGSDEYQRLNQLIKNLFSQKEDKDTE